MEVILVFVFFIDIKKIAVIAYFQFCKINK